MKSLGSKNLHKVLLQFDRIVALVLFVFLITGYPVRAAESDKTEKDSAIGKQTTEKLSVLDRRIANELETRFMPFVLTPHKPNYVMPYTYNSKPNNAPFSNQAGDTIDNEEIKFQISIKFPVLEKLFGENGTLYFAYTNLSFWQAYSSSASSPFRETNHEPELFVVVPNDWEIWGFKNKLNAVGVAHQSNGQSGTLSRSWNRVYAQFVFEHDNYYVSFKPWLRLGETGPDDNPDIEKYMGHGEFAAVYATGKHTVGLLLRNNLHAENYGAVEINYSYPMSRRAKWFIQYFDGYGESLIDYNARIQRIGLGIALTDWL